jgi:hypothetical protein
MTNRQTTDVLAPGCDAMKLQRAGTAHAMYLTVVTCTDTCNVLLLFKCLLSQWPLLYHHFVPRLVAVKLSKGVIQGPWTKNSIRAVPFVHVSPSTQSIFVVSVKLSIVCFPLEVCTKPTEWNLSARSLSATGTCCRGQCPCGMSAEELQKKLKDA